FVSQQVFEAVLKESNRLFVVGGSRKSVAGDSRKAGCPIVANGKFVQCVKIVSAPPVESRVNRKIGFDLISHIGICAEDQTRRYFMSENEAEKTIEVIVSGPRAIEVVGDTAAGAEVDDSSGCTEIVRDCEVLICKPSAMLINR